MKRILVAAMLLCALSACNSNKGSGDKKMDKFINELMSKMTLQEKLGQLNLSAGGAAVIGGAEGMEDWLRQGLLSATGGINPEASRKAQELAVNESRLGIPLLVGLDVIHGYRTIFPIPLGLACTWDATLIEQSARIAANEASTDGVNWFYSPMTDIARDPRWGRVAEGSGEDPYLGSEIARAMVRGYQGTDLSLPNTVAACLKHFALYGASEAGRDYNTVDMSRVVMYNEYLPPYQAAVEEGVATAMSSFNLIEGVPATGNHWLLTELLRDDWGFNGFVVSDFDAVGEMTNHGLGDTQAVSAQALKAGLDMDMMTNGFITTLEQSLKEGKISQKDIDTAVRRILEVKYKLGLFEDPYRYFDADRRAKEILSEENLAAARNISANSIVLLKNADNLLPLKKAGTIAVIGPLAKNTGDLLGTWVMTDDVTKAASVYEAIKESSPEANVLYARGTNFTDAPQLKEKGQARTTEPEVSTDQLIREAVAVAQRANVIVAAMGEPAGWSGEACSRSEINLPESQQALLKALLKTGKPVVLVLMNGRPLTLTWEDANLPAIVEAWHGGTQAGRAIADVLFGDHNPSGKLTMTFPRSVGQIPLYYNAKRTGRPAVESDHFTSKYLDDVNDPLYPFGYGLSYTTFTYGAPSVDKAELQGEADILTVSVDVTNTGAVEGQEVVQLYTNDPVASISRPMKELKKFAKINLKPGEKQTVTFQITPEDLKFYNAQLNHVFEPGAFNIYVGSNSRDLQATTVNWL